MKRFNGFRDFLSLIVILTFLIIIKNQAIAIDTCQCMLNYYKIELRPIFSLNSDSCCFDIVFTYQGQDTNCYFDTIRIYNEDRGAVNYIDGINFTFGQSFTVSSYCVPKQPPPQLTHIKFSFMNSYTGKQCDTNMYVNCTSCCATLHAWLFPVDSLHECCNMLFVRQDQPVPPGCEVYGIAAYDFNTYLGGTPVFKDPMDLSRDYLVGIFCFTEPGVYHILRIDFYAQDGSVLCSKFLKDTCDSATHFYKQLGEMPTGNQSIIEQFYNIPNPFDNETTVYFKLNQENQVSMEIFNALGQQLAVLNEEIFHAGLNSKTINTSGYLPGRYYIKIKANTMTYMLPVIITR